MVGQDLHVAVSRSAATETAPGKDRPHPRNTIGAVPTEQWVPKTEGRRSAAIDQAGSRPRVVASRFGLGIAGIPPVVTGKRCPAWMLDEDAELRRKHKAVRDAAAARRKRGERSTRAVR